MSAQPLQEHLEYMLALHKNGELLMGGPVVGVAGGLVILKVDSKDRARALIGQDPAIIDQTLKAKLYEWGRIA